ncbi:globin [Actinoplanes sp. NBRC 103695]|uniref:globin n=1 Tax=Actinoplanes sp. NBRC 103695 TaxID=3032202 RepID=UPI0025526035|nr:globin [Actinoplanes sp. NBRC 103695]
MQRGPAHTSPHPGHGSVISTGPVSIDPVSAVSGVSRAVPGQYPEPVTPGMPGMPGMPGAMWPRVAGIGVPPAVEGPGHAPPAPADGMNPADDAVLREVQRLLSNSLSLAGGTDEVATRLRAALILAQPQLVTMLPGSAQLQREQLAQALTWLAHNLDNPPAVVAGCVQLGGALAACGIQPAQLQLVGAALAEAMRAGMAANGWRQDFDQAWRSTWQHVHEWMGHGAEAARYQPVTWLAEVVSHELRRPDLAVVRIRPYLPFPVRAGQYARIEVGEVPGVWRPYSLAGRGGVIELHVRAKTETGVSGTLVYRTQPGDQVRFSRAEGSMGVPPGSRDLLLVAGDTGVAPLKAMLGELAATGDPRSAVLFWGVRDLNELYDMDDIALIARACRRATVVPVVSEGDSGQYASGLVTDAIAAYGEWSEADVFLAGPPVMLAATSAALQVLGVAPERIHHDAPEG